MRDPRARRKLRGASTITQQVAKNLFLWSGHSFVRKGLEAMLTVLIEAMWPKERILEIYLNIAQFGHGIYGVEAAAQRFFHHSARSLTRDESALLAVVLPNPELAARRRALALCAEQREWTLRQMAISAERPISMPSNSPRNRVGLRETADPNPGLLAWASRCLQDARHARRT